MSNRKKSKFHLVSLGVSCFALWLLLSGHFSAAFLGLGFLSSVLVVVVAQRMDIVDREGHPVHLVGRALRYWSWLGWEIVKSNIEVTRCVLDPRHAISPVMFRAKSSQRTDLGRVIFANSITLTPGTLSTRLEGDEIEVHALTREMARDVLSGEMDRQVTRMEGEC